MDHRRVRYLVDGDQLETKDKKPSIEPSTASDVSLQIKPLSKTHQVLETPTRSEDNSVVDRVPQTVLSEPKTLDLVKKVKITRPTSNEGPKDVLGEAILEAQKFKHLV